MTRTELQARTKKFHVDVIKLCERFQMKVNYWLEVVTDAKLQEGKELDRLTIEANELTAIFAATDKTNKAKRNRK